MINQTHHQEVWDMLNTDSVTSSILTSSDEPDKLSWPSASLSGAAKPISFTNSLYSSN